MLSRRLGAILAIAALVLFSFQNCGQSNFAASDGSDVLSTSSVTLTKDTSPLAFDVGLDAIAFNSCVPNTKSAGGFFTLKATAGGSRGGVRMNPTFYNTAKSQLVPIYGNADVLDVQYKQLIENTNPDVEFQVGLRSVTDYRAAITGTSTGGIWGRMDYLSNDAWLTPIVDSARRYNNQFVPYSNRAPTSKSRFDYSFSQDIGGDYWAGLQSFQNFKNCISQGCSGYGRFTIAAGFTEPNDKNLIRGPSSDTSSAQTTAYGRGYALQLGYPDNRTEVGLRSVKAIQEFDMQNQTQVVENGAATAWDCTEIPIMSSIQRGPSSSPQVGTNICNPMPGSYAVGNFSALKLSKIRELLPSSQWQLGYQMVNNSPRLCVIPVGFDCYPNENYQNIQSNGAASPYPYYVSYTAGESCLNEENMAVELAKSGAGLNRVCAHYVTVCTKR